MLNAILFGFGIGSGLMALATLLVVRRMYQNSQVHGDIIAALIEYQEVMEELRRQEELENAFADVLNRAPGIEEI